MAYYELLPPYSNWKSWKFSIDMRSSVYKNRELLILLAILCRGNYFRGNSIIPFQPVSPRVNFHDAGDSMPKKFPIKNGLKVYQIVLEALVFKVNK